MPVVQKQCWTETSCLHMSIRDRWRLYSHEILVHRAKKKVQVHLGFVRKNILPFIGEWYIPLKDVTDALS